VDFLDGTADEDDRLEIRNQGSAPGQVGVSGNTVTYGGDAIGTVRHGIGTFRPLTVVFSNGLATPDTVQAVLRNVTYRSLAADPPRAPRRVSVVVRDEFNGVSAPATKTINVDAPGAPRVVAVYADSTGWTDAFRQFLAGDASGASPPGFLVPDSPDQSLALPWNNVNRLRVRFSEGVAVDQADLVVRGVSTAVYGFAPNGFTYDAATFTTTWTLSADVARDKLLLDLDADSQGVTDASGNPLDGEWAGGGADTYPSGDGSAGGDFRFQINVMPGDATGDGSTDVSDLAVLATHFNGGPLGPRHGDFNGDTRVDVSDLAILATHFNKSLPAGAPAAPASPARSFARPAGVFGRAGVTSRVTPRIAIRPAAFLFSTGRAEEL
jgi:hypothetical protein